MKNSEYYFYINNEHRKYMGLKPLKDSYELIKFKKYFHEYYVFFDNNKIVKIIEYSLMDNSISIHESDVDYNTTNNKTILLPKTPRGKERKLTWSVIKNLEGYGNYFFLLKEKNKEGRVTIANYTTQRTFYEEKITTNIKSFEDIKKWCDNFVKKSSAKDLKEVQEFAKAKRQHINYQEGDYFRVKLGKNEYTYGRILMDVFKRQKKGLKYWHILMGRPLIIEIFHILTTNDKVSIEELENLPTFPSQHILDNNFYYGDYQIIGNKELPKIKKYPIMYGKSISGTNPNKICFQCGEIYKEIEYTKNNLIQKKNQTIVNDFKRNSIGFHLDVDAKIIKNCIYEKSNDNFWKSQKSYSDWDLRSPNNKEYLKKVLKQFDLDYLYTIYND